MTQHIRNCIKCPKEIKNNIDKGTVNKNINVLRTWSSNPANSVDAQTKTANTTNFNLQIEDMEIASISSASSIASSTSTSQQDIKNMPPKKNVSLKSFMDTMSAKENVSRHKKKSYKYYICFFFFVISGCNRLCFG